MFKELLDIILNVKIFVFIYRPICVISEIFLLERLTVMNGTKGYLSFLGSGTTLIIHIRHLLNYESILCSVYVREQPLILAVVICFLSLSCFMVLIRLHCFWSFFLGGRLLGHRVSLLLGDHPLVTSISDGYCASICNTSL